MKRFHVHVGVTDLDASVTFYTEMFGAKPSIARSDYAKWMLEDPRVNFAISQKCGAVKGVEHLGLQAETTEELSGVYARLAHAGRPVLEEGATICCYAQSEKSWISDPDGVVWEAFHTHGESTTYGEGPDFAALSSDKAAASDCCAPALAVAPPVADTVKACC